MKKILFAVLGLISQLSFADITCPSISQLHQASFDSAYKESDVNVAKTTVPQNYGTSVLWQLFIGPLAEATTQSASNALADIDRANGEPGFAFNEPDASGYICEYSSSTTSLLLIAVNCNGSACSSMFTSYLH